jgi:hypothetical protein
VGLSATPDHQVESFMRAPVSPFLNYVGSINETTSKNQSIDDVGNFFGAGTPALLQGYGTYGVTELETEAHELRLSSEERLFGFLNYIVGGFYQNQDSPPPRSDPVQC